VAIITYGHPTNFELYDANSIDRGCLALAATFLMFLFLAVPLICFSNLYCS